MAMRIDGKKISAEIKEELKEQVARMKEDGISVCLAVIQVGNDPASSVYVGNKKKACAYIGIESRAYELPEETTEEELLTLIDQLNKDDSVNGILVQLPIPDHMDEKKVIEAISPKKMWTVFIRRVWEPFPSGNRDLSPVRRRVSSSFSSVPASGLRERTAWL